MARRTEVEVTREEAVVDTSPQPAPAPLKAGQVIGLDAWALNRFGAKHLDQAAGFKAFCAKQRLRRLSSQEWDSIFTQFSNKPVG